MHDTTLTLRESSAVTTALAAHLHATLRAGSSFLYKVFLLTLFQAARLNRDVTFRTCYGSWVRGSLWDAIPRETFARGGIEYALMHFMRRRLAPGDVFVDVGAHSGYITLLGSQLVQDAGSVVAIEASPKTFALLQRNLGLNPHARNVRAVNVAAADKETTLTMFRSAFATGLSHLRPPGSKPAKVFGIPFSAEGQVRGAPLADLVTAEESRRARLIKIDCEGGEFEAVFGLRSLLHGRDDLEIIVETAPIHWGKLGRTPNQLIDHFAKLGFHAYMLAKGDSPTDAVTPVRVTDLPDHVYLDLVFSRVDAACL